MNGYNGPECDFIRYPLIPHRTTKSPDRFWVKRSTRKWNRSYYILPESWRIASVHLSVMCGRSFEVSP